MGIAIRNFVFINKCFENLLSNNVKGKWMLELGNQRIREKLQRKYNIKSPIAKEYFTSIGIIHHSIDINGKEGAIPIDLSKPITNNFWINKFDIGTNFGTLEHVTNKNNGQWQAWKNLHNTVKKGGMFIHGLPDKNAWPRHCNIRYDIEFVEKLAEANNYKIIYNELSKKNTQKTLVMACLIKENDNDFMEDKNLFVSWINFKERKKVKN
jgi:hypothetical protein